MVQGFNEFKGLISSSRIKGSIILRVELVQGWKWFKGSNSPMFQSAKEFNWLKGSISSGVQLVQLVQGFNWFKGSTGSLDQWFQGFKLAKGSGV